MGSSEAAQAQLAFLCSSDGSFSKVEEEEKTPRLSTNNNRAAKGLTASGSDNDLSRGKSERKLLVDLLAVA